MFVQVSFDIFVYRWFKFKSSKPPSPFHPAPSTLYFIYNSSMKSRRTQQSVGKAQQPGRGRCESPGPFPECLCPVTLLCLSFFLSSTCRAGGRIRWSHQAIPPVFCALQWGEEHKPCGAHVVRGSCLPLEG
ncbi:hypothetical protein HJG60_008855 [Phyllostomus discolor]|uniref:Uncharacterized protein n=1 Tax=Phyllostomus discolor TaxID=89673 RepID=A0A833YU67_9CHIR|nr:hypothetical protein HJG60_008855 [Phyllostomus discolor]